MNSNTESDYYILTPCFSIRFTFDAYDYPNSTVKMSEHSFKKNETFSEFTTIQIMKLNKTHKVLPTFSDITSKKSKITSFDFQDCIIKLIETRNVLAHELSSPNFKDKHIIDILSDTEIEELKYDFLNNHQFPSFQKVKVLINRKNQR